jgi:DegV family protein with EDD domain
MKIGVVVDSSCDLPEDFIERHRIKILPNTIQIDKQSFVDRRDARATLAFYHSHIGDLGHQAETTPLSVEAIQQMFLDQLVLEFDYVLCIPAWKARSEVYHNALKASHTILSQYHALKKAAGHDGLFSMRVIDSRTISAGTAVLAAHAAALAQKGVHGNDIRLDLDRLTQDVVAYYVPADLAYIRKRAARRGEKSVGLAAYVVSQVLDVKPVIAIYREQTRPVAAFRGLDSAFEHTLDHVGAVVRDGAMQSPYVCVSYGGDPACVRQLGAFRSLERTCRERGVELLLAIMSAPAAVNTGPGGLAVSYIGDFRKMH